MYPGEALPQKAKGSCDYAATTTTAEPIEIAPLPGACTLAKRRAWKAKPDRLALAWVRGAIENRNQTFRAAGASKFCIRERRTVLEQHSPLESIIVRRPSLRGQPLLEDVRSSDTSRRKSFVSHVADSFMHESHGCT